MCLWQWLRRRLAEKRPVLPNNPKEKAIHVERLPTPSRGPHVQKVKAESSTNVCSYFRKSVMPANSLISQLLELHVTYMDEMLIGQLVVISNMFQACLQHLNTPPPPPPFKEENSEYLVGCS